MNYPGTPLSIGSIGEAVKAVQERLQVQPTAVLGPTTLGAIKAFQAKAGLTPDGVVGPATWKALFAPRDAFSCALAFALRWEGGYSNNAADKGGETNRGVTWRTYDAYRTRKGLAKRSVRMLEEAELQEIYRDGYWRPIHGDTLPLRVAVAAFDVSVNAGPGKAKEFLTATAGVAAPLARALAINHARRAFYAQIIASNPSQRVFRVGWENRVAALDAYVKEL